MPLADRLIRLLRGSLAIFPVIFGLDLNQFFRSYANGNWGSELYIVVLAGLAVFGISLFLKMSWRYALAGPVFLFGVGFIPEAGNEVSLFCAGFLWLLFALVTFNGLIRIDAPKTKSPLR